MLLGDIVIKSLDNGQVYNMNTCADCGMMYDAEPLDCQWLCPICEMEENKAREENINAHM